MLAVVEALQVPRFSVLMWERGYKQGYMGVAMEVIQMLKINDNVMHVTKENVAMIIMIAKYIKNSCLVYAIRISAGIIYLFYKHGFHRWRLIE